MGGTGGTCGGMAPTPLQRVTGGGMVIGSLPVRTILILSQEFRLLRLFRILRLWLDGLIHIGVLSFFLKRRGSAGKRETEFARCQH